MMRTKNIAGTQIWAWSDDIFCVPNRGLEYGRGTTRSHFIENQYRLPDRGLVGDAPWGVVDGWRRKKAGVLDHQEAALAGEAQGGPDPALRRPASPSAFPWRTNMTSPICPNCAWTGRSEPSKGVARADRPRTSRAKSKSTRHPPADGQVLCSQDQGSPAAGLVDAYQLPFGQVNPSRCRTCDGPRSGRCGSCTITSWPARAPAWWAGILIFCSTRPAAGSGGVLALDRPCCWNFRGSTSCPRPTPSMLCLIL